MLRIPNKAIFAKALGAALILGCSMAGNADRASATPLHIFRSHVPAASRPNQIDGKILFKSLSSAARTSEASVDHCLLIHGYVVGQSRLETIEKSKNADQLFDRFWQQYFGTRFVQALISGPCGDVTIAMQESIQTTALEMTVRTEEFLRSQLCAKGTCAVFGHSKGAMVVTNMARRCMEETSMAGPGACQRLSKFYSSAGNNLGASYAALIYGLYLEDPNHSKLAELQRQAKLFRIDLDLTTPGAMDYIPGQTNPMWIDISPLSPQEDGVPVAIKNNISLEKKGWLVGDYAASASDHDFENGSMSLFGCGPRLELRARAACTLTGFTFASLHSSELQEYFERGLSAWKGDKRFEDAIAGNHNYLNNLSWQSHQIGDGMAEQALALGTCKNGGSAVASCRTFSEVNHAALAGSNTEVQKDVIEFLESP
ncbi:MAG: hypothetical protein NTV34_07180 [Proteobacteria bacterium]|nr:hypothetical protein [Pseudomonadota bacterium]